MDEPAKLIVRETVQVAKYDGDIEEGKEPVEIVTNEVEREVTDPTEIARIKEFMDGPNKRRP